MNNHEFDRQLLEQKTDSDRLNQIIVSKAKLDEIQTQEIPSADIVNYGITTGFILIGAILFLNLLKVGRQERKKIVSTSYFSQIPCRKCRFFLSNPNLNCTVHPSTVLTDRAKDCSDYWAINGKFLR
jgi:hypothetical protein